MIDVSLNRLPRLVKRMLLLIRINVLPNISCFSDSFNDKDLEFLVTLFLKDNV
jgi:hypothetical protein